MMRGAVLCAVLLLLSVVAHGTGTEAEGRHRHRHFRHLAQKPAPKARPTAAEQVDDLEREYDQATGGRAPVPAAAPKDSVSLSPGTLPTESSAALRDLQDATSIKGQFNEFLARVSDDSAKLEAEVKAKDAQVAELSAKASSLELTTQEVEAENNAMKKKVAQQLQGQEAKFEKQLKALQTQNQQLTTTNLKLVGTNDELSKDLQVEKARNQHLIVKLQNMATTFTSQQKAVQQLVSAGARKVAQQAAEEAQVAQDSVVSEEAQTGNVAASEEEEEEEQQAPPAAAPQPVAVEEAPEEEEEGTPEEESADPEMQEVDSEVAETDGEPLVAAVAAVQARPAPGPRRLTRKMAARTSTPKSSKKSKKRVSKKGAPAVKPKPQAHALAGSSSSAKKEAAALPPLPLAPPKKENSDATLDKLRAEVQSLSTKPKVEPVMGAIQKEQHKDQTDDPADGLSALQDVGKMLKDVEGI